MSKKLKCDLTVYVPTNAAPAKIEKIKNYGAKIEAFANDCMLTECEARKQAEILKKEFISPYNDIDVVKGQGTIGVELLK